MPRLIEMSFFIYFSFFYLKVLNLQHKKYHPFPLASFFAWDLRRKMKQKHWGLLDKHFFVKSHKSPWNRLDISFEICLSKKTENTDFFTHPSSFILENWLPYSLFTRGFLDFGFAVVQKTLKVCLRDFLVFKLFTWEFLFTFHMILRTKFKPNHKWMENIFSKQEKS